MQSFLAELKRRNVLRVAGVYLVAAWLITQVAGTVLPMFDAPAWAARSIVLLLAIFFVPVLIVSWLFELTPQGLKLDAKVPAAESIAPQTARRLDRILLVVATFAIVYFAIDKFMLAPRREAALLAAADASRDGVGDAHSIAVLPFLDLSQAKDQEYFSDGLSEELLNLLAQLPQLRVIARTSSFSFKGKEVDVATIARALGVGNVLEGSVRKSGNTLRVTAQLIRASDSSHLWSQTFDRELTDVFAMQDEIASAVVSALKVKLLPAQSISNPYRSSNAEAYEHYLIGRQLNNNGTVEGWTEAREALHKAIALDPDFAAAYAALGYAEGSTSDLSESASERETLILDAVAHAEKAMALAPDFSEGYVVRGYARMTYKRDWDGARADFERAIALSPSDAGALVGHARLLATFDRLPEAIAESKKAIDVDPVNALGWAQLGRYLNGSRRFEEARAPLERAISLAPAWGYPHYQLGLTRLYLGDLDGAIEAFKKDDAGYGSTGIALAAYKAGDMATAQAALDETIAKYAQSSAFQIAEIYAWRNEKDKAFEWLDRAVAQDDGGLPAILIDPLLANVRDDPRFAVVLKKLNLAPRT